MSGGNIVHFAGIRVRVVGSGNFRTTYQGFDNILTETMPVLVMATTNSREMVALANFISARGKVRMETTAIDEVFKVNNLTMFLKPLWSQYPA